MLFHMVSQVVLLIVVVNVILVAVLIVRGILKCVNYHMCLSVDVGENFLSRFRPSDASSGGFSSLAARKKSCSNFLHHFFSPLCLILPTLHICGPTNFPSRSHIGKMGVTRSQRLCYSTPPERDPPFITFTTRRTAVAVECLRFYPGGSAVAVLSLLSKTAF